MNGMIKKHRITRHRRGDPRSLSVVLSVVEVRSRRVVALFSTRQYAYPRPHPNNTHTPIFHPTQKTLSEPRCVPREASKRKGGKTPNYRRDEGGPLVAVVQAEATNHPLLLPLREVVVSEMGKGSARHCQVRTVESNESEPLMKCRKYQDDVKTRVYRASWEESGRHLFTAQMASGIKAARMRSRLFCGTWEPVTPMRRERYTHPKMTPGADAFPNRSGHI